MANVAASLSKCPTVAAWRAHARRSLQSRKGTSIARVDVHCGARGRWTGRPDKDSPYREKTLKFFEVSQHKACWYFFAVAGLNITKKLITTLSEDKSEGLALALISNWQFLEEDFNKRRTVQDGAYMAYNNYNDSQETQSQKQLKSERFLR